MIPLCGGDRDHVAHALLHLVQFALFIPDLRQIAASSLSNFIYTVALLHAELFGRIRRELAQQLSKFPRRTLIGRARSFVTGAIVRPNPK